MLRHKIDRHAGAVNNESDRRRCRDERFFREIKSEHCSRTNSALIADQAAKRSRSESPDPFPRPLQLNSIGKARNSR